MKSLGSVGCQGDTFLNTQVLWSRLARRVREGRRPKPGHGGHLISEPQARPSPRNPARIRVARHALFPETAKALLERLHEILCEPTRLKITRALTAAQLTVGDLGLVIGQSESSTSRHLRVLRDLGVVRSRIQGRFVYNTVGDGPMADAAREILGTFALVIATQA
jgi:DNA-binding transcriptional ArsR family regulator